MNIQTLLREKREIEFEGVTVKYVGEWQTLEPGDTYMAERNAGPKLLTVREVKPTIGMNDEWVGAVFPIEMAYPYDLCECVKVEICLDLVS